LLATETQAIFGAGLKPVNTPGKIPSTDGLKPCTTRPNHLSSRSSSKFRARREDLEIDSHSWRC
jgi:hypothetical protein